MKNSIVFCTNNLIPEEILKWTLSEAISRVIDDEDTELIIVSHYPVREDWIEKDLPGIKKETHDRLSDAILKTPIDLCSPHVISAETRVKNIVVGEREYSIETIIAQLKLAASFATSDNIIIFEHDVLYPENYIDYVVEGLKRADVVYWKNSVYFDVNNGFFSPFTVAFSRYAFKKDAFLRFIEAKEIDSKYFEPRIDGFCESTIGKTNIDKDGFSSSCLVLHGEDVLDIHHGMNATGNMVVEEFDDLHHYWGPQEAVASKVDDGFKSVVKEHPIYNYGLFMI